MPFILTLILTAIITITIFIVASEKASNRVAMLWMIATAVKHEMPLPDLIKAQARESWGNRKKLLLDMSDALQQGTSLAEAIDTYRVLIPEQGRLAIHLGSETGTLNESLDAALKQIEQRPIDLMRDFYSYMFYLSLIFGSGVMTTSFLMYFIVPKFKEIFFGFGVDLPPITMNFLYFSDLCVNYFYLFPFALIVLTPVAVFVATRLACGLDLPDKAYAPFKFWSYGNRFSLFWLVFAPFLRFSVSFAPKRASADVLRYLGVVAQADRPIFEAVESLSQHHQAPDIRRRLRKITNGLKQGGSLWDGLMVTGFLSRKMASLLRAAEVAGDLPYALSEKSQQIERENFHQLICFMEYVRVFTVLLLCLLTTFVTISMFMPLVQLMNDLS